VGAGLQEQGRGQPLVEGAGFRPEATARLFPLGTVHGDPQGYERAWKLLDWLKPDVISVEISRFSLHYRLKERKRWQRRFSLAAARLAPSDRGHLALKRIAAQIELPFEYRVAVAWGRDRDCRWVPLDLGGAARKHLPHYERELLKYENMAALLKTPDGGLEDFVAQEFARERRHRPQTPAWLRWTDGQEDGRRRRFWARRLLKLAAKGERIVHLGGWEHLIPEPEGKGWLELLAGLRPCLIWLDEADKLPGGG
jgi:hypothetical protein